jgi:hypothetical protein
MGLINKVRYENVGAVVEKNLVVLDALVRNVK